MGSTHPPGPALVTASADADPVTLLVLGWLAAKRSENTRTAYARDIGITPQRRVSRAPSWLAWCQEQGVHPVTGVTGLHVARYARQLDAAGLSPASAARKLAAVSGWYAWLAQRGHIAASPAAGIARPRADPGSSPPPALTRDQALALVHAADTAPGPQRARTAALVAVLLFTGARVSEVIGADVGDLGTERGHRVQVTPRSPERHGVRRTTHHPAVRPGPAHRGHSSGAASAAAPGTASACIPGPRSKFRTMAWKQASLPRPAASARQGANPKPARQGGRKPVVNQT